MASFPGLDQEHPMPPSPGGVAADRLDSGGGRAGVPGNRAIWVGIFAELTEFALMFLVYFFARIHHPGDFHEGPRKLSLVAGTTNTLIMITSSYMVARAVLEIRADRQTACLHWLLGALLVAAGYPLVKFFEIRWNLAQGLTGGGDVFQMSYYYLTLNHLVHVSWGLLGLLWVIARTATGGYSGRMHNGLVAFASYWHATDLIWLMIFPLFYVLP